MEPIRACSLLAVRSGPLLPVLPGQRWAGRCFVRWGPVLAVSRLGLSVLNERSRQEPSQHRGGTACQSSCVKPAAFTIPKVMLHLFIALGVLLCESLIQCRNGRACDKGAACVLSPKNHREKSPRAANSRPSQKSQAHLRSIERLETIQ